MVFNLLVGFSDESAMASRVVEYTDDALRQYVAPAGTIDLQRLVNLPTLIMPELGDSTSRQVARVGHIEDLRQEGRDFRFRFVPSPTIPEIATGRIEAVSDRLRIAPFEFSRTHWAVKDADLYRVLAEHVTEARLAPRVFRFPTEAPRDDRLVAVMMPFEPRFDRVYEALGSAAADAGLECRRADDIWEADHILDDILGLIWSARVVISDLSGKNPNVFYETGIAHSLGRDVVQIVQNMDDVPFDLRSIRTVTYLANGEGLTVLQSTVAQRLRNLTARA
jgi:hypothetical protein